MDHLDYKKIKSIHFIGVKGVGMAPLAIIAKEAGFVVTGCDTPDIFITDEPLLKANVEVYKGFSQEHLEDVDLVITTGAHGGYDNPEVIAAKEKNIPVVTQGEAVGIFIQGQLFNRELFGISVAGCHGKTTTTAMIATMLMQAGNDPSYVIGTSNIAPLGAPGHFGKGKFFVAEADEYATEPKYDHTPKFLWQHPAIAVITNIEHDHPDLYPTIADVRSAYIKFAQNVEKKDVLVCFGDDQQVQKLLESYHGNVISYGFSSNCDYRIYEVSIINGQTHFKLDGNGISLGKFQISVGGEHNALNAVATIIVGLECGLSLPLIQKGLTVFHGTKRRYEIIGNIPSGALLIDDYAHHPTEIKKTLRTAREQFKDKKILCIFQPHTYSRTKLLFQEFSSSFINVNEVILLSIYPSARESADSTISAELLASEMRKFNKHVLSFSTISDVVKYIKQKQFGDEYVIITMGAGDVYKIGEELLIK